MEIKNRMNSADRLLAGEEALDRCSRGHRGMGGARGGAARCGGGAARCGEVRRSGVRSGARLGPIAPTIAAREEGGSGKVGNVPQSSKRARESMGSKRGVRRSWWRSLLPVGACEDVRRPQMGPVVVLQGEGGFGGGGGTQEGSERVHGGAEEVWEATAGLLLPSTRRWP